LHFEGYKYDSLLANWLKVLINVFNKFSHVQVAIVGISFWNELVVITTTELKPTKGRIELAIVPCTYLCP
jgi:hypothetical protein